MRSGKLVSGAAVLGLVIGWGHAAAAQDNVSQPEPAAQEVDEIIVTARRRAEVLQDVPASVTAITEADREGLVLDRVDDYLRQVQGTTLVTSGPEYLNDITIRGQGSGRVGFTETATGLYRDGLYNSGGGFGGRTLSRLDLFDLARMEVLRGPQGALFGRNAVGGAINVVSNTPDDFVSGNLTLRYSDPERIDLEGVVNIPLGEQFAARIGAYSSDQDGGFIYNTTTGNYTDTQTSQGARIQVQGELTPTAVVGLTLEYADSDAPAFSGLAQNPTLDPSPYVRADQNREGRTEIEERAVMLRADFNLGWADLALRAARRERDGQRTNEDDDHFAGLSLMDVEPGAGVSYPDYSRAQFEDYARNVYQATLTSAGDSDLSWLIGIEYLQSEDAVVSEPEDCLAYTGAALVPTPGCFVGSATVGAPTTFSPQARNQGRVAMNHDTFNEDVGSFSVFGAIERRFAETWMLGAELRIQNDDRAYDFERWSEDPLTYFGPGAPPPGMLGPLGGSGANAFQFCPPTVTGPNCSAGNETARVAADFNETFYTPALSLRWNYADRQNLYWRFATAYRSGGFNTNLPPTMRLADMAAILRYDAEYAYNYEMGWKGRVFGFSAEAAIYYTWTNEVQVVTAPSAGASGFILSNAGDARVYGFEAEARRTFDLGPGRLITRFGFSTSGGEFEDGASLINQGVVVDLSGLEVPRLRDYQITANLLYTQDFGALRGFVGVSGQFADGGFENPDNSRTYDGYQLFDARIGVEGDHWRLSAFGRNLTDERYVLNVVSRNEFWSQPRIFGVELRVRY